MALRPCIDPDCARLTTATRCEQHEQAHQRERNLDPRRRGHPAYRAKPAYGDCACCGTDQDITRHHVVPLASVNGTLGGAWIPMCRSCNSSIGARVMVDSQCPQHGGVVIDG